MSNRIWSFVFGLAITAVVLVCHANGVFEALENRSVDWRFSRRVVRPEDIGSEDPNVVIVAITSECLERQGRWPWGRDTLATLVNTIQSGGPRVIGLDIQFYDQVDPVKDRLLTDAIGKVKNVVLASDLVAHKQLDLDTGELVSTLDVREPLKELAEAARGTGLVNHDPYIENTDGVLRKTPLAKRVGDRQVPGFPLRISSLFLGTEPVIDLESSSVGLGNYAVPTEPGRSDSRSGNTKPGQSQAFEQCAWVNFSPLGSIGKYFYTVTASNVLRTAANQSSKDEAVDFRRFAGKIVLVGFAALGEERDQKLTPQGLMPGVEFQANVIRNLLEKNFLVHVSPGAHRMLFGVFGILLSIAFAWTSTFRSISIALILGGAHVGVSARLFSSYGKLLDVVPALVLVGTLLVGMKLLLLGSELRRKFRDLKLLHLNSRYFSTTLQLDELKERVLEVFVKLSGADSGALAVVRDDLEDVDLVTRGQLNEKVAGLLARRAVQDELVTFWKDGAHWVDGVTFARRPKVAPDLAALFSQTVFLPAMQTDRVAGWLMLTGPGIRREILGHEERDFWFTLASIGLTAIQNGVLYKLATVDSLTTLFVRHFFDIEIEKTFGRASRYQENLALLMTDIDHFKKFNDTYGHQMGDRVLRVVAAEVKRCVRLSDVACRYGGEEFAVILPATDVEGARLLAERIRTRIGELRIPYQGGHLEVTCSVGLSCMSLSGARTTKQFIEEADAALYEAKKGGRNRVCVAKATRTDEGPTGSQAIRIPANT